MAMVEIDDELRARFQAVAAPEEDLSAFVAEAIRKQIKRREAAQAILNGPHRPATEVDAEFRRRHNFPDRPRRTLEQIADEAERVIAAMDPQVRADLEREGWI